MKIHGLTVCVNYSDFLEIGIGRLRAGLDSILIVTDESDEDTARVARKYHTQLHRTNIFYANGAAFNKGAAIEEARKTMPWRDWILFFDSDIAPEEGWKLKVEDENPSLGILYSAWRHQCLDVTRPDDPWQKIRGDGVGCGYFQLFHSADPNLAGEPLVETHWAHAGCYDSQFMHRWPNYQRKILPIRLAHLCPSGKSENWFGRGNREAFDEMQAERKRRGGRWDHETIHRGATI